MKKIVILQHGGGELANQLWNYISIYAYAKEVGVPLVNNSFFEYGSNFEIPKSPIANTLLYRPFKNYKKRRDSFKRQLWRNTYKVYVYLIKLFKKNNIISSTNANNKVFYLPPSSADFIAPDSQTIYFTGWLFRNPEGISKYREDILEYFKPIKETEEKIEKFLRPYANKKLVGVHIRQGDYRIFKDGKYFIEQSRVREILNEYIDKNDLQGNEILFVITSDGKIDENHFQGLNYTISNMGPVEDLFLLARTDVIIGSDSSFGDFAAWYADVPHIILQKDPMNWEYYKRKERFFYNKYSTMTHY